MADVGSSMPMTDNVVYMLAGVASTTAFLTWFISQQFRKMQSLVYRIISKHNKEDDDRFAALDQSIWQIHLRNAMRDNVAPPERKPFPRRRYLVGEDGSPEDLNGSDISTE